jgi:hypothetical protein
MILPPVSFGRSHRVLPLRWGGRFQAPGRFPRKLSVARSCTSSPPFTRRGQVQRSPKLGAEDPAQNGPHAAPPVSKDRAASRVSGSRMALPTTQPEGAFCPRHHFSAVVAST